MHLNPTAESSLHQGRGDKSLAEGRLEDAAAGYRQAVLINPNNGAAFCGLGMIYIQQGLLGDAELCLKQAASAAPAVLAQAYYLLGSALQKHGKLNEAADSFGQALKLYPDAEIIYSDLCFTLFQLGKIDAAKDVIMRGLLVNPAFVDFHFFLGNLYAQEKEFDKAIACYRQALAIQPDFALAHLNLGKMLYEQGKIDEAIGCFQKTLELNPNDASANYDLGLALQKHRELKRTSNK